MLKNNNMKIVSRMAWKRLTSNRRLSITMVLAVLLSSFMLFSIFTVGVTYFKMQRLQNIRLNGAEFDAIMYGVTEKQMKVLKDNPDVEEIGISAVSGYVEETPYDKTPDVGLMYADKVYWEKMMAPARESVTGNYPVEEDEVMVTKEALKQCGFSGLGVGDTLDITYGAEGELHEKTFCISGIWDGYGAKSIFYVSERFYRQTGFSVTNVNSGRCFINLRQKLVSVKYQDEFIASLELGKTQRLFFTGETGYSVRIFTGMVCLVLVICLCAYLLIYNIMYISTAGNIRYYGLLQTVGMTGRQIYGLMRYQMLFVGGIGISGGILLGSGISFILIPGVMRTLGIRTEKIGGIEISFHPAIFLLTILFTAVTVWAAGRKPAGLAVASSPVEALGYRPASGIRKNRRTGRGKILWRLSKDQLSRDKKKSAVVISSLAVSMSVFLCMVTLISSQGAREYYTNLRNLDMVLKNDTVKKPDMEEHAEIFDGALFDRLDQIEGITSVDPVIYTEITVPWEPDFADRWMREFYETWMTIPYEDEREEYKEHPENFGSVLVGIGEADFQALNDTLEEPVSKEAFLNGETCLLYRNTLTFEEEDIIGETVTCADYNDRERTRSFKIAGLTDETGYNALATYPPVIIVSDRAVREFAEEPIIFKIGITYAEEYDEETEGRLLSAVDQIPRAKDYSYDSKIELMKTVKKAQGNMMEVGICIVLILGFIGLMNYTNTSAGSIQSRRVELSVMESIGMTEKQMRRMLIQEGLLYAGGAWMITLTAGVGITYYLYQSANYMGAEFKIPLLPVAAAAILTFGVCIGIPLVIYRQIERGSSVAERIRGME